MKNEESTASKFLMHRFNKDPVYEPLGKSTPPDFSIGRTAFEVRRLNQRYFHEDGTNEGLEQVDIPLNRAVYQELAKIQFWEQRGTVFWGLKFRRPLLDGMSAIVSRLAAAAQEYYLGDSRAPRQIDFGGATLDLFPSGTPLGKALRRGHTGDDDSGGMLGDIYPTSIRLALEDKIAKTKSIVAKFDRWVLILVDDILPTMMEPTDIGPLSLNLGHFHSVVILNPDATVALEYPDQSLKLHEAIRKRAYDLYEQRGRTHGQDLDDWLRAETEPSE